ncbi:methyltransferase [Putridiphycobacter roseus]|uniref:Methyltransferase n=1 Tax=Putridiphycobacter roseus TaxID=2219161 RepID=A0A2W1N0U9_9FLAO|nr:tRNA (5-methylaminomethyl-2-thiouridine)(34)-methyltransferase MnmD [Putridiphycobacter roseus]PZE18219.1 methyltransferase [Putridiphycobacter roseus]
MKERQVIITGDNSKSLLIKDTDISYHSIHGAKTESNHIFIAHGLNQLNKNQPICIFEMGFGTGLNALLTLEQANKQQLNINYHSIEKYPLHQQEWEDFTEKNGFSNEEKNHFKTLHETNWETQISITPKFELKKIQGDILTHTFESDFYDIIYFDAFGPGFQPELWKPNLLQKLHNSLKTNGFLITYCAQGQFKRDLKSVGFKVENLPGPPGKREITKGIKL